MRLVVGLAAVLLLTVSLPVIAEDILTIHKVEGETDKKGSTVTVKFGGNIPWSAPELEDHGGFLQVKLPQTITPESGAFLDGTGPYIEKMAVFQTTAKDAALRLFVSRKSDLLKNAATIDILEDRLILNFDNEKLAALGVSDHEGASTLDGASKASASDFAGAVLGKKSSPEKTLGFGKDESNDLKGKTGAVAVFSIIMMTGLMVFHLGRRFFRRRKNGDEFREQVASIKTLATHAIAPKHRLTLVQVGGEQILLGVSPEGISFLTAVGREKSATLPPAFAIAQPAMPVLQEPPSLRTPTLSRSSVTPERKKKKDSAPAPSAPEAPRSTFSVAVDDEGIRTLEPKAPPPSGSQAQKSIEDVTSLIRRKLRNLPNA